MLLSEFSRLLRFRPGTVPVYEQHDVPPAMGGAVDGRGGDDGLAVDRGGPAGAPKAKAKGGGKKSKKRLVAVPPVRVSEWLQGQGREWIVKHKLTMDPSGGEGDG